MPGLTIMLRRFLVCLPLLVGACRSPQGGGAVPVITPDASLPLAGGAAISFDDVFWSPGLAKIISPAGQGGLHIVDPDSAADTAVAAAAGVYTATASASFVFAVNRGSRTVYVVDPA